MDWGVERFLWKDLEYKLIAINVEIYLLGVVMDPFNPTTISMDDYRGLVAPLGRSGLRAWGSGLIF